MYLRYLEHLKERRVEATAVVAGLDEEQRGDYQDTYSFTMFYCLLSGTYISLNSVRVQPMTLRNVLLITIPAKNMLAIYSGAETVFDEKGANRTSCLSGRTRDEQVS